MLYGGEPQKPFQTVNLKFPDTHTCCFPEMYTLNWKNYICKTIYALTGGVLR